MTRPRYESEEDRTRQQRIIEQIEGVWKCWAHKLPDHAVIDYALCREPNARVYAYAEVKHRECAFGQYPDYMISTKKVERAMELNAHWGRRTFLIVEFVDTVYYTHLDDLKIIGGDVRMGGRKDRGDPQDTECVVHIPLAAFGRLLYPSGAVRAI